MNVYDGINFRDMVPISHLDGKKAKIHRDGHIIKHPSPTLFERGLYFIAVLEEVQKDLEEKKKHIHICNNFLSPYNIV